MDGVVWLPEIHACPGIIVIILVVIQPIMALLHPKPGAPKRYNFNWVHLAVGMSAWIIAVATVFPGGGCRLMGASERNLGLPDPGGCRYQSCCLSQESLWTQFLWLM